MAITDPIASKAHPVANSAFHTAKGIRIRRRCFVERDSSIAHPLDAIDLEARSVRDEGIAGESDRASARPISA